MLWEASLVVLLGRLSAPPALSHRDLECLPVSSIQPHQPSTSPRRPHARTRPPAAWLDPHLARSSPPIASLVLTGAHASRVCGCTSADPVAPAGPPSPSPPATMCASPSFAARRSTSSCTAHSSPPLTHLVPLCAQVRLSQPLQHGHGHVRLHRPRPRRLRLAPVQRAAQPDSPGRQGEGRGRAQQRHQEGHQPGRDGPKAEARPQCVHFPLPFANSTGRGRLCAGLVGLVPWIDPRD